MVMTMPHDRQEKRRHLDTWLYLTWPRRLLLIATGTLLFLAPQLSSQSQTNQPGLSSPGPQAIQQPQTHPTDSSPPPEFVVPLSEADETLNNLDSLLRRINARLSEGPDLAESAEQARLASQSLGSRAEQATRLVKESPTRDELLHMEADWRQQTRTIERQRGPVTQRLKELEKHI